jgi:hypothetical protein
MAFLLFAFYVLAAGGKDDSPVAAISGLFTRLERWLMDDDGLLIGCPNDKVFHQQSAIKNQQCSY